MYLIVWMADTLGAGHLYVTSLAYSIYVMLLLFSKWYELYASSQINKLIRKPSNKIMNFFEGGGG